MVGFSSTQNFVNSSIQIHYKMNHATHLKLSVASHSRTMDYEKNSANWKSDSRNSKISGVTCGKTIYFTAAKQRSITTTTQVVFIT